jgi:hypothetical protein
MIDWQDAFFDGDSPEKSQYDSLWEDWRCRSDKHFAELDEQTTVNLIANYYKAQSETNEELYERACSDKNLPYSRASLREALIHRIGRRDLPRPTAETTALLSSFYGQWRSSDEQLDELPEGSR